MRPTGTDGLYEALRAADPDVMDADELATITGQIAQLTGWCDSLQVRQVQRPMSTENRSTSGSTT